jgi:hypothetical protein
VKLLLESGVDLINAQKVRVRDRRITYALCTNIECNLRREVEEQFILHATKVIFQSWSCYWSVVQIRTAECRIRYELFYFLSEQSLCCGRQGYTPLMCASNRGHMSVVAYLLDCGADLNCLNKVQLCS